MAVELNFESGMFDVDAKDDDAIWWASLLLRRRRGSSTKLLFAVDISCSGEMVVVMVLFVDIK